jgi:CubicO group peptidase (beta-lactamase class C family)
MTKLTTGLLALLLLPTVANAQQAPPGYPDAKASDPVRLGFMVGSPPAADRLVAFEDGSYLRFPQLRWALSHWRELRPTAPIYRGSGKVRALPRAERTDIDAVTFTPLDGGPRMTWAQSLDANYTDGIVVLHHGTIVYEKYFGALTAQGQHIAHSVTKSFFGTLAAMLVDDGKLDENALVSQYLPELKNSAFGDATVRQLLDMTTAIKFSEKYTDPNAEIWDFARSAGMAPQPGTALDVRVPSGRHEERRARRGLYLPIRECRSHRLVDLPCHRQVCAAGAAGTHLGEVGRRAGRLYPGRRPWQRDRCRRTQHGLARSGALR